MAALVLGSSSPRRAKLLAQLGVVFTQRGADIDEAIETGEAPHSYVQRIAREKARALQASAPLLLTADTTVIADGQSLGKPKDRAQARDMLARLSASEHEVCTAVCLLKDSTLREILVRTRVEFVTLSGALIEAYLDTGESRDKAGAYAIQGLAGSFVRCIQGSVSNVIGLPLAETRELLECGGIATGFGHERV